MIPAQYYQTIYLIIVIILTIILSSKYSHYPNSRIVNDRGSKDNLGGYLIAIAFALFIGFRPFSYVFVDMMNYRIYYYHKYFGIPYDFDWLTDNVVFDNLYLWMASNTYDLGIFMLIISLGYFLFTYKAMSVMFKNDALYGFVVWLGAFSTFSYATNGIKAGIAASVFLCALAYRKKPIIASLFLLLCLGLHHSMILPVAAYVVCFFFNKTKYYLYFWFFAMFIAFLHIPSFQQIFSGMADERGAAYLTSTSDWGGKTGFRIDFIFYSALPVVVGYYAIFKRKIQSKEYEFIYNTYLLTNGIWMLCMYAEFTNRIAYLSWGFLPIVTMYPFFNKAFLPHQYRYANYIVWYQLIFTLAMTFIYYA